MALLMLKLGQVIAAAKPRIPEAIYCSQATIDDLIAEAKEHGNDKLTYPFTAADVPVEILTGVPDGDFIVFQFV